MQAGIGLAEFAGPHHLDGLNEGMGGGAGVILHAFILVEVDLGPLAGLNHADVGELVAEDAPQVLGAGNVAVHDDREQPPRQVARIIPASQFKGLGLSGFLPVVVKSGLPPSAQTRRSIIAFDR